MGFNMSKLSYYQKLKDPRWQKRRLEVLDSSGFACQLCSNESSTLHVHHNAYISGRDPWDYDEDQLTVLCEECHKNIHEEDDEISLISSFIKPNDWPSREAIAYLIAGFYGLQKDKVISLLGNFDGMNEIIYNAGIKLEPAVLRMFLKKD